MFRHERHKALPSVPPAGIAEVFGTEADIDAELIMLTARWWRALGISEHVSTELNSVVP